MKWMDELFVVPIIGALFVGYAAWLICAHIGIKGWQSHPIPALIIVGYLALAHSRKNSN
jgi:hypothetical protein